MPSHVHESLKVACEELRSRLKEAEEVKSKALNEAEYLMGKLKEVNAAYEQQQTNATQATRHGIDIEKRNMELCWQQVEWKAQLEVPFAPVSAWILTLALIPPGGAPGRRCSS